VPAAVAVVVVPLPPASFAVAAKQELLLVLQSARIAQAAVSPVGASRSGLAAPESEARLEWEAQTASEWNFAPSTGSVQLPLVSHFRPLAQAYETEVRIAAASGIRSPSSRGSSSFERFPCLPGASVLSSSGQPRGSSCGMARAFWPALS